MVLVRTILNLLVMIVVGVGMAEDQRLDRVRYLLWI